jgi:uncharacterized protein YjbI with pentapeptide repeats
VTFSGCKLLGTDWTLADKLEGLVFSDSCLDLSGFRMLKLPKLVMTGCQTRETDFIETDLSGADLTKTDFENSRFHRTNLSGADLTGALHYAISINDNMLKKARFSLPEALSLLDGLDIIVD